MHISVGTASAVARPTCISKTLHMDTIKGHRACLGNRLYAAVRSGGDTRPAGAEHGLGVRVQLQI